MKWNASQTNPPPRDGTLIIAWCGDWTTTGSEWMCPVILSWRTYHPNSPGKGCWREPRMGTKHFDKGDPQFWLPLSVLSPEGWDKQIKEDA